MKDIEDRLRDMYDALTSTIVEEGLPGLNERRRPARRWFATFAPLMAAAAVVIAVAGAVTLPELVRSTSAPHPAPARHSLVRGTTAAVPPYLIVFDEPAIRGPFGPVVVMSEKTGRIIGHVPAPRKGSSWYTALPTGSATTFLLAATLNRGGLCNDTYLYTLTLSASGKPTALTPWTDPVVHMEIEPYAASADGGTIAFSSYPCRSVDQEMGVIRGNSIRTWRVPYPTQLGTLSLTADGSELSYVETTAAVARVRLLDTAAPAGLASAASRIIYTYPQRNPAAPLALISPDGTNLYVAAAWGPNGFQFTGMLAGYRIGGGMLFRWQLKGLRVAESLNWAGGKLVAMVLQGRYLIDPVTGKATQYRALPLNLYAIAW